ncbi:MAG TPA: FAD-dependent oxidoreductase [Anaerolineaceae bacterium]|nr:FAD-dependent oxidoreductase [Anaerolineaceae bacterium]
MNEVNLLIAPGRINGMTTRNRIVMSSACTAMCSLEGYVTEQMIDYYAERGRGGAGIINVGYSYVDIRGKTGKHQMSTSEDSAIPYMRELTKAFHAASPVGTNIGAQLNHAGRQTNREITGFVPEAPSPIPGPFPTGRHMEVPEELSIARIHELVKIFAQAAWRCKEAGFDLVEIHAAHGYLLSQFISPYSNLRTDEYGGTLEKRLRIVQEVLEETRGVVGPDFPVGIRINGDDMVDGGYTIDEYRIVAQLIEKTGYVDYISVSAGQHHPDSAAAMVAPMSMPLGFLEYLGAEVRSAVEKTPIFIVGRIKNPISAEGILQRGSADYVVMTRALMADPELPNKTMTGQLDDIRPCITCMQGCTDRTWAGLDLTCLVNPAAGREKTWSRLEPAPKKKRVLVVGGGPAGMETARVAALRGHDVTLWEQSETLGGTALLASIPPHREEFSDLPRWLSTQLPKVGVKVILGKKGDSASVRLFAPDVLVAATGAKPEIPEHVPGWNLPQVITIHEALSGQKEIGDRVLILGHSTAAVETAEWLAERNKQVFLVSGAETQTWEDPMDALAYDKNSFTGRHSLMESVMQKIEFIPFKTVKAIEEGFVTLSPMGERHPCTTHYPINDVTDEQLVVDTVIIHLRQRPVRAWMEGLDNIVSEIYKVGDCREPRLAIDAMADGGRVGRLI